MKRRLKPVLPGVHGPDGVAASKTYDGRDAVRRARRMANVRDVTDTALLLAVDWIFFKFPSTRVPLLTRDQTLMLLIAVHIAFALFILFSRIIPAWRARHIASTWSESEKKRASHVKRSTR